MLAKEEIRQNSPSFWRSVRFVNVRNSTEYAVVEVGVGFELCSASVREKKQKYIFLSSELISSLYHGKNIEKLTFLALVPATTRPRLYSLCFGLLRCLFEINGSWIIQGNFAQWLL